MSISVKLFQRKKIMPMTNVWTLNHDVPIKQFLPHFIKTLTKVMRSLLW